MNPTTHRYDPMYNAYPILPRNRVNLDPNILLIELNG